MYHVHNMTARIKVRWVVLGHKWLKERVPEEDPHTSHQSSFPSCHNTVMPQGDHYSPMRMSHRDYISFSMPALTTWDYNLYIECLYLCNLI